MKAIVTNLMVDERPRASWENGELVLRHRAFRVDDELQIYWDEDMFVTHAQDFIDRQTGIEL